MVNKTPSLKFQSLVILITFPIIFYFLIVLSFAQNIPNSDDFDMFLSFLNNYLKTDSDKFSLIFSKHGEHIIGFTHLATLFFYYLTNKINFYYLIIFGNISLLLVFYILLKLNLNSAVESITKSDLADSASFFSKIMLHRRMTTLSHNFLRKASHNQQASSSHDDSTAEFRLKEQSAFNLTSAAIVSLLLFNLNYVELSIWSAGALEHLWVMVFVLAAIYYSTRVTSKISFLLCPLFSLASFLTQGNGLFTFLACSFVYFFLKKKFSALINFLFFLSASTYIIFSSQVTTSHLNQASNNIDLSALIIYSLSFIGSCFSFGTRDFALFFGILFFVLFSILFRLKKFDQKSLAFYALILFIVLTSLANALSRMDYGASMAYTQTRYHYPAIFAWIALYFIYQNSSKEIKYKSIILAISLSFCIVSNIYYLPDIFLRNNLLKESKEIFTLSEGTTGLEYPIDIRAKELLTIARSLNIYNLKKTKIEFSKFIEDASTTREQDKMKLKKEQYFFNNRYFVLRGYTNFNACLSPKYSVQFNFQGKSYIGELNSTVRPDAVRNFKLLNPYTKLGFYAAFDLEESKTQVPEGIKIFATCP